VPLILGDVELALKIGQKLGIRALPWA